MIDEQKTLFLHKALSRVFALPISRSTFREVQSAVMAAVDGDKKKGNELFELILSGNTKQDPKEEKTPSRRFQKLVDEFSIKIWVAKDVFEKGEFISMVTSDIIDHPMQFVFSNRIKKIDGQDVQFVTDMDSSLQLVLHFLGRIEESKKSENAKKALNENKRQLQEIKKKLDLLLAN